MRIILFADMEGITHITDYRECFPVFPQYWQTGRDIFTEEVVAAAQGLLSGGASSVTVVDGHGPGSWANLIAGRLPDGGELLTGPLQPSTVDAAFHVGFHARCGTPDGFMSHTHVPEFRLKVNGSLITENHNLAWSAGVPVLGITGDHRLHRQLDGVLAGTPFLEVKQSTSRTETKPLYRDRESASAAVRDFARECLRVSSQQIIPEIPFDSVVAISMKPRFTDSATGHSGLQRESPAVVAIRGSDWRREIRPGIGRAAQAASQPLDAILAKLDLSSEQALNGQDPTTVQSLRDLIDDWMHTLHGEWED